MLPCQERHGSVFHHQIIPFRAADQQRPKPFSDRVQRACRTTFCGTEGRSSGFFPWTSGPRLRAPTPAQAPLRQAGVEAFPFVEWHACAVYGNRFGLCSFSFTPCQFGQPARVVKEMGSLTGSLSAGGRENCLAYVFSLAFSVL